MAAQVQKHTSQLGINTTANSPNRLALKSSNALFDNEGASHRLAINNHRETDTSSVVFQQNNTGHAELGLNGSNDLSLKVSADGAVWKEAFVINQQTGGVNFPCTASVVNENLLINAQFNINQRGFSGGPLAASSYWI